jgi:predicted RNA-binding protein
MADNETLNTLEHRIAIVRDNLRNLVEQAAGLSGAADETRASDRIARQEELLAQLNEERSTLNGPGQPATRQDVPIG